MSNGSSSRKKATEAIDEVEELLRASHDDVLLKLSVNSHIARSGSSTEDSMIDPDLDRRFQALKSKPKIPTTSRRIDSDKKNPAKFVDSIEENDDLFARFAAIKSSLPSYSSSSSVSVGPGHQLKGGEENESENEEDEVEKLINWAIDAARLDPSPPSDVEDDEDDSDFEKDSDDEDNDKANAQKKNKRK